MSEDSGEFTPTLLAHDGVLAGERLAFTGTLASMTHQQAHELAEKNGGVATASVSRQTTMLIVGEEGWPLESNGTPSLKLQQVLEWQHEGASIRIVQESDWLEMLGLDRRDEEVRRQYTPAMLSQLLNVPVGVIRSWERAGLIRPVRHVFRLPYFEFQEVAGARRLAEMIAAGVPKAEIEAGLAKLKHVLPGIEQPLVQLELLARDKHVVYRDRGGLVESVSGQRLLDFDGTAAPAKLQIATKLDDALRDVQAHWTADEWFDAACRHLENQEVQAAVEAFRLCLIDDPSRADANWITTIWKPGRNWAACMRSRGSCRGPWMLSTWRWRSTRNIPTPICTKRKSCINSAGRTRRLCIGRRISNLTPADLGRRTLDGG